jgi:hypothetical protein
MTLLDIIQITFIFTVAVVGLVGFIKAVKSDDD